MIVDLHAGSRGYGRLAGSALMRELLLSLPLAVAYAAGPDLVFEFANEECRRFAGGRDLIGVPLREVPELAGQRLELVERAVQAGQPLQAGDCELRVRRQGREPELMVVNFTYRPVRDDNGDVGGVLVYGSDVTAYARDRHEPTGAGLAERTEPRFWRRDRTPAGPGNGSPSCSESASTPPRWPGWSAIGGGS